MIDDMDFEVPRKSSTKEFDKSWNRRNHNFGVVNRHAFYKACGRLYKNTNKRTMTHQERTMIHEAELIHTRQAVNFRNHNGLTVAHQYIPHRSVKQRWWRECTVATRSFHKMMSKQRRNLATLRRMQYEEDE